jgi:Suppressor of fused protein (SUFU)
LPTPIDRNEKKDLEVHEMISCVMEIVFGPVEPLSLVEVVPVHDRVRVKINMIRPTFMQNRLTLFTTGMSSVALKVPRGQEKWRYVELMMHLPPDWPLPDEISEADPSLWPIRWLREIAYYPHLNKTWLGGPSTIISSDDPPVPSGA